MLHHRRAGMTPLLRLKIMPLPRPGLPRRKQRQQLTCKHAKEPNRAGFFFFVNRAAELFLASSLQGEARSRSCRRGARRESAPGLRGVLGARRCPEHGSGCGNRGTLAGALYFQPGWALWWREGAGCALGSLALGAGVVLLVFRGIVGLGRAWGESSAAKDRALKARRGI